LDEKYLLKAAVGDLIPRTIRSRPKQPYRAPDSQSFLVGPQAAKLFDYVEELLAPKAIQEAGLFDARAVGKLLDKARYGQVVSVKDNMSLVGILSTQIVVNQFIKNFPRSM
jgi:asparagine synthase (glutamine-hydrolysing)